MSPPGPVTRDVKLLCLASGISQLAVRPADRAGITAAVPMADVHRRMEERADKRLRIEQRQEDKVLNALNAIRTKISGPPQEWVKPSFTMPMVMPGSDVEDYLGALGGVGYYRHRKYGELREHQLLSEHQELPNLPMVQIDEDGQRLFQTYEPCAPGTYERLLHPPTRQPKPEPPSKPRDAIALTSLGGRRSELLVALEPPLASSATDIVDNRVRTQPPSYIHRPPVGPARGAPEVIARIRSKKAEITLTADRQNILVTAPGGRVRDDVSDLAQVAAPILVPFLRDGSVPPCAVTNHPTAVEAVTVARTFPTALPWCGECGGAA